MFTATLLTIAKIWKQPKCPSVDEWIKKLCYIYTMVHTVWPFKKKKEREEGNLTLCNSMDGPEEHYAK